MNKYQPAELGTSGLRMLAEFRRDLTGTPADARDRMWHTVLNRSLHNPAGARNRRPRFPLYRRGFATLGAAALVAGVVAVGVTGQGTPPGGTQSAQQPASSGSVALTFELAAMHAETEPFTPPRPDQWNYVELKIVRGKIAQDKGQAVSETTRSWQRADGRQYAEMVDGKLEILPEVPDVPNSLPPQDYPTLAELPTEPQTLLDWLRAQISSGRDDNAQLDADTFNVIAKMLRDNVLPPSLKATLLRALALVPGAAQSTEPVNFVGRPAIAVGMLQDGWRQEDILLDPTTHEFLGSRTVVAKDHELPAPKAEGRQPAGRPGDSLPDARSEGTDRAAPGGVRLKEGDVEVELIRVTGKIVDAPGQTN